MNKIYKCYHIKFSSFIYYAQNGILNVGFDIDDTVLFSRDVFLNLPDDKRNLLILVGLIHMI